MLSKETKEKLQSALLKLGIELPAKEVVKLEDVTLIDGSILSVDKMEVGANATFTGADGVAVPADGEFELADGSTVVCVAGAITELKPKEADVQPEPVNEEMKAILSRLEALENSYKATQTTLETQLSETKKGLEVALEAINVMDNNAVAINLEAQTKVENKSYNELSPLEKFKLRKENKFVG
jgi:hypothetical protein